MEVSRIDADGNLYCKGKIKMKGTKFIDVSDGYFHTVAIDEDGILWGWYQMNLGSWFDQDPSPYNEHKTPVKIMEDVRFTSVTAGQWHTVAIDENGGLWEWNQYVLSNEKISRRIWAGNPVRTASTWAHDGIIAAIDRGFVPAEIQGRYTNVITRAEFCRMAVKWVEYALGKDIDSIVAEQGISKRMKHKFSDTTDPAILAAYRLGITTGSVTPTSDKPGKFNPNGKFTRQEAATMIMKTCKVVGMDVSNVKDAKFKDISTASKWAVDAINFVSNNGIMSGTKNNNFNPKATFTRERSIIAFNNIKLDDFGITPATPEEKIIPPYPVILEAPDGGKIEITDVKMGTDSRGREVMNIYIKNINSQSIRTISFGVHYLREKTSFNTTSSTQRPFEIAPGKTEIYAIQTAYIIEWISKSDEPFTAGYTLLGIGF